MRMEDFLDQNRELILNKWYRAILADYSEETSGFLQEEKDRFVNPVGHTFYRGITGLYEELLADRASAKVPNLLKEIIKIRAVQDFPPSQAVGFIFLLKKIIRKELEGWVKEKPLGPENLLIFENKLDELALLAFDVYLECREKLYKLRINEFKNRTARLLQQTRLGGS